MNIHIYSDYEVCRLDFWKKVKYEFDTAISEYEAVYLCSSDSFRKAYCCYKNGSLIHDLAYEYCQRIEDVAVSDCSSDSPLFSLEKRQYHNADYDTIFLARRRVRLAFLDWLINVKFKKKGLIF